MKRSIFLRVPHSTTKRLLLPLSSRVKEPVPSILSTSAFTWIAYVPFRFSAIQSLVPFASKLIRLLQAPLTVQSNSPLELLHQMFVKLGARFIMITDPEGLCAYRAFPLSLQLHELNLFRRRGSHRQEDLAGLPRASGSRPLLILSISRYTKLHLTSQHMSSIPQTNCIPLVLLSSTWKHVGYLTLFLLIHIDIIPTM